MSTKMTWQVLLMALLIFGSTARGVEMPPWINNDRALKSALKAAKTPEDHMRIAAYYNVKADRMDADAADYERAAAASQNAPVVKNLTAPNTAARYESIANTLRQEAQSTRRLAAYHVKIASDAEQAAR